MHMKRLAAVCLAVAAGVVAPATVASAQAPSVTIATVDRVTPVAAFGGRVAWSAFDPATRTFSLVTRAGGVTQPVPVPPRRVPFDVDLGPGPDGGTVAVYSRCDRDPPPAGSPAPALYNRGVGCDIFLFDFATGAETRVAEASSPAASEFFPTIWRDTIAFGRTYDDKRAFPYVYTRRLGSRAPSLRMPGGPRNACFRNRNTGRTRCSPNTVSRPMSLDLWGSRLAFTWTFSGFNEGLDTEIRLDTIGGDHRLVAHQGGGGLTQIQLGWPGFENGRVHWVAGCFGDPGGCPGRVGLRRYRITTREIDTAPVPAEAVLSHDRDAGTSYVLVDRRAGTDCLGDPSVPGGTCPLQALQPAFG